MDRGNSEGHLLLAQAYHSLGDYAAFKEHSEKAIEASANKVTRKRIEKTLAELGESS
jgi:hypothetical protein